MVLMKAIASLVVFRMKSVLPSLNIRVDALSHMGAMEPCILYRDNTELHKGRGGGGAVGIYCCMEKTAVTLTGHKTWYGVLS